jgi:hypothetical protein
MRACPNRVADRWWHGRRTNAGVRPIGQERMTSSRGSPGPSRWRRKVVIRSRSFIADKPSGPSLVRKEAELMHARWVGLPAVNGFHFPSRSGVNNLRGRTPQSVGWWRIEGRRAVVPDQPGGPSIVRKVAKLMNAERVARPTPRELRPGSVCPVFVGGHLLVSMIQNEGTVRDNRMNSLRRSINTSRFVPVLCPFCPRFVPDIAVAYPALRQSPRLAINTLDG